MIQLAIWGLSLFNRKFSLNVFDNFALFVVNIHQNMTILLLSNNILTLSLSSNFRTGIMTSAEVAPYSLKASHPTSPLDSIKAQDVSRFDERKKFLWEEMFSFRFWKILKHNFTCFTQLLRPDNLILWKTIWKCCRLYT